MPLPERAPATLALERFDLIVVGGGIYGVMLCLEAVRRRLRPLLVERADFGGATSHNSQRIVHGGLRYLQSADLPRFYESVQERRWFLRTFPDFVQPLPCLMPLYGAGLRTPGLLRLALALNDLGSARRNVEVPRDRHIPPGRILDAAATRDRFPGVDTRDLRGGALWHDALMPSAPLQLIETLRWACERGAAALNYVEAQGLIETAGRVAGIRARDLVDQQDLEFHADAVVNAAGPWARQFSAACGHEHPPLFEPALAWNVVFRREALADAALAVAPRRRAAQTYFLVPWKGALLAGTGHAPWRGGLDRPGPTPEQLLEFIADLNAAVPGLELTPHDVHRVFAGLLPATRADTSEPTTREVIVDHGARGGPGGFFSLSGVKLTTARRMADKVLRRAFPAAVPLTAAAFPRPAPAVTAPEYPYFWMPPPGDEAWQADLRRAAADEAVQHLSDLLLRRSNLGDNPDRAFHVAPDVCRLLGWDAGRTAQELADLANQLGRPGGASASDPATAAAAARRRT